MIASVNSTLSASSSATPSQDSLVSIGVAARLCGLSIQSLRRLSDKGAVRSYAVAGSGHRRFYVSDVMSLIGADAQEDKQGNQPVCGEGQAVGVKVALLARVSSDKQGKGFDTEAGARKANSENESDLERQVSRLRGYASEKYGVQDAPLYSDIGSGLNFQRKSFQKLMEEILQGKWKGGVVLATYKDRVCRFGFELVQLICQSGECRLELIEQEEVSDETELASDILGIITHFSAKKHGMRSAKNNTLHLEAGAVVRAQQLRNEGYTIQHVARVLNEEGYFCQSEGLQKPRKITKWVLYKHFEGEKEKLLEAALPSEGEGKTSFQAFVESYLEGSADPTHRIKAKEVWARYTRYCETMGETPVSRLVAGLVLKTMCKKGDSNGRIVYIGLRWIA